MRIAIARTMSEFSIDIYTDNLIAGLKIARPEWEIIELTPKSFDRCSSSLALRIQKYYERFWRYPKFVQQQVADIFHVVEPCDANIAYWLKNSGKPLVVTCHDLANYFFPGNLQGSVQLPIISRRAWLYSVNGMHYADHIITVSTATAKDTIQILKIPLDKITTISNAVEPIFRPSQKSVIQTHRQEQGLSIETFCLLNVGSNDPRKNIQTILKALIILKRQDIPIQFWKVGTDFTTEQKKFIEVNNLKSSLKYLGRPDKSTLVKIYSTADILVAPSLYEGFGITILESMACGTPVITSNISAMPEVVGDAGVLVTPTESDEIAAAIINLYQNPSYYKELVDLSLKRAAKFTWINNAEKVAQVYEKVLSKKLEHSI
jgi:glycosyltransferase involved in cell wall biosynthesis